MYAQVKNLVSTTLEKFGRLDFLVNNGGGRIRIFMNPIVRNLARNVDVKSFFCIVGTS